MRHGKCDPLGPFDRPNLYNYILTEILLRKVRHEKCDPLFGEDRYSPVDRPNFHNCALLLILHKKVRHEKCDQNCDVMIKCDHTNSGRQFVIIEFTNLIEFMNVIEFVNLIE